MPDNVFEIVARIKADTGELGKMIREMQDAGHKTKEQHGAFKEYAINVHKVTEQFGFLEEGLKDFGITSLTVGGVVGGMIYKINELTQATQQLHVFSEQSNVTADFLERLAEASKRFGMSQEETNSTIGQFANTVAEIGRGPEGGPTIRGGAILRQIETYGTAAQEVANVLRRAAHETPRDVEKVFMTVQKYMDEMEKAGRLDPQLRARISGEMGISPKISTPELLPALDKIGHFLHMSPEQTKEWSDAMSKLNVEWGTFTVRLQIATLPALRGVVEHFGDMIVKMNSLVGVTEKAHLVDWDEFLDLTGLGSAYNKMKPLFDMLSFLGPYFGKVSPEENAKLDELRRQLKEGGPAVIEAVPRGTKPKPIVVPEQPGATGPMELPGLIERGRRQLGIFTAPELPTPVLPPATAPIVEPAPQVIVAPPPPAQGDATREPVPVPRAAPIVVPQSFTDRLDEMTRALEATTPGALTADALLRSRLPIAPPAPPPVPEREAQEGGFDPAGFVKRIEELRAQRAPPAIELPAAPSPTLDVQPRQPVERLLSPGPAPVLEPKRSALEPGALLARAVGIQSGVQSVEGVGRIFVTLAAPKGTMSSVETEGMFRESSLMRASQMDWADQTGLQTPFGLGRLV
jgi:hypothetical protein